MNINAQARCRDCPCNEGAIVSRPDVWSTTAIVIDQPTDADVKADTFFTGRKGSYGAFMRAALESLDVDLDDVYVCTASNCKPNIKKQAMLKKAMNGCRMRLIDELKTAGVERVLCVGPVGYSQLMSLTKVAPITGVRGRWMHAYGMDIMATLPPGFIFAPKGFDYFRDFAYDVEKFFTKEPEPDPDIDLWVPDSVKEMEEAFEYMATLPYLACDLETTGFSPIDDEIICAGFCGTRDDVTTALVVPYGLIDRKRTWQLIARVLNSEQETVLHNAKFDLQHLLSAIKRHGFKYKPRNVHDTLLLHYLGDERPIGRFKSHGLETLARTRYDAPDYGINVKEFLAMWRDRAAHPDLPELERKLYTYNALDCYYTMRLYPDLWNELIDAEDDLDEYWNQLDWDGPTWGPLDCYENLLIPGMLALAEVEHFGIELDIPMFEQSREDLAKRANKVLKKLQRKTGIKDFNPGSPKQVQELIYNPPDDPEKPGLGLPFGLRTDKDGTVYHTARRGGLKEGPTAAPVIKALAYRFPEHEPIIDMICDYRNITKNAGTYVNGLLNRADSDGRIRSSFNLAGTSTGRLSSSNPNLQNVPDASHTGIEIRGGFVAPPGWKLIEADYKQLEVRIAAWLSGDDVMKEIFQSGRDPHQEIAYSIYKKPKGEVSHYMRWLAKNILFGLLYGRGYESVATGPEQEDIARYGGQRWSIEQVKEFFENLLADWETYAAWQQNQRALGYANHGVMMPTGRRRRFDFIPRQDAGYVGRASFNNPVQGVASDFTLYALIQLHAKFAKHFPGQAHLISTVHDSLLAQARTEVAEEVMAMMRETMENDTLFDLDVPLKVDIEMGDRWGMKEELAHVLIEEEE